MKINTKNEEDSVLIKYNYKIKSRDSMTDKEFNTMMEIGYNQAIRGEGRKLEEVIRELKEGVN